jgi:hypothetical protein
MAFLQTTATNRTFFRAFVISTLIYFAFFALWSLGSPIGASPDEPRHVATAYGAVHGGIGNFEAQVPSWIAELGTGQDGSPCYAWNPNQTADCISSSLPSSATVSVKSQFGSYFPVYYLVTGSPTLVFDGQLALMLMRLVSALISAVILGLATWTIKRGTKNAGSKLNFIIPLTLLPMAVFLYGSVNSSGMEIASSVYFWCASLILFSTSTNEDRKFKLIHFAIAAILLLSTRLLAPLWLATILVIVSLCVDQFISRFNDLIRKKDFQITLTTIALFTMGVLVWDYLHPNYYLDPNQKPVSSVVDGLREVSQFFLNSALESVFEFGVGRLGWADTVLPFALLATLLIWGALAGAIFTKDNQRKTIYRVCLILLTPVVASSIVAGIGWSGVGWQGRYSLPLLLGIPTALVYVLSQSDKLDRENSLQKHSLRLLEILLFTTLSVLTYAFVLNYHRYSAGTDSFIFTLNRNWSPIVAFPILLLAFIAAGYSLYVFTVKGFGNAFQFRNSEKVEFQK